MKRLLLILLLVTCGTASASAGDLALWGALTGAALTHHRANLVPNMLIGAAAGTLLQPRIVQVESPAYYRAPVYYNPPVYYQAQAPVVYYQQSYPVIVNEPVYYTNQRHHHHHHNQYDRSFMGWRDRD